MPRARTDHLRWIRYREVARARSSLLGLLFAAAFVVLFVIWVAREPAPAPLQSDTAQEAVVGESSAPEASSDFERAQNTDPTPDSVETAQVSAAQLHAQVVFEESTDPVANARVIVSRAQRKVAELRSDVDGQVSSEPLPPGTYHVSIQKAGFYGTQVELDLPQAAPKRLGLYPLEGNVWVGRVEGADQRPISLARVEIQWPLRGTDKRDYVYYYTNSKGEFTAKVPAHVDFVDVFVTASGFLNYETFDVSAIPEPIVLQQRAKLRLQIVSERELQKPLTLHLIGAEEHHERKLPSSKKLAYIDIDWVGEFDLQLEGHGMPSTDYVPVKLVPNETTTAVLHVDWNTPPVRVHVIDAAGRPVVGASVFFALPWENARLHPYQLMTKEQDQQIVETDEHGYAQSNRTGREPCKLGIIDKRYADQVVDVPSRGAAGTITQVILLTGVTATVRCAAVAAGETTRPWTIQCSRRGGGWWSEPLTAEEEDDTVTYSVRGLGPGRYELQAKRGESPFSIGLDTSHHEFIVPEASEAKLEFDTYSCFGTVYLDDAPAFAGQVHAVLEGASTTSAEAEVRADGTFDLLLFVRGKYSIYYELDENPLVTLGATLPSAAPVMLRATSRETVDTTLQFVRPDGQALTEVRGTLSQDHSQRSFRVGSDGTVLLTNIVPGTYRCQLGTLAMRDRWVCSQFITITSGGLQSVAVEEGSSLYITVTTSDGSVAPAFTLVDSNGEVVQRIQSAMQGAEIDLYVVPASWRTVTVRATGYVPLNIVLNGERSSWIDATLRPAEQ
ncbi:MAG: carboxypeptidase-like regulatory domain-containing protein [Planctomycetota bacterium]